MKSNRIPVSVAWLLQFVSETAVVAVLEFSWVFRAKQFARGVGCRVAHDVHLK
jgi:hypothetical protein